MDRDVKRCSMCGQVKPLDDFGRIWHRADGRQNYCKKCACEYQKRRREQRKGGACSET